MMFLEMFLDIKWKLQQYWNNSDGQNDLVTLLMNKVEH